MLDVVKNLLGKWVNGASRDSQGGFTLIEMSIVLAIIGLIVGGVLKGQEVLNGARIKSQVAQIDAIKAAVVTFQDKYGFLPGDFAGATALNLSGVTTDGDENGAIAHGGASVADSAVWDQEGEIAFLQLTAASLLSGGTPTTSTTAPPTPSGLAVATRAWMPGKFGSSYLVLQTFLSNGQTAPMVRLQSVIPETAPTSAGNHPLRPVDASSLDQKYDDGAPSSGSILAGSTSTTGATGCVNAVAAQGNQAATSSYGNGTTNACDLLWVLN